MLKKITVVGVSITRASKNFILPRPNISRYRNEKNKALVFLFDRFRA
jgi:hypothetical protein